MASGNATVILVYLRSISKLRMVERTMDGGVGRPGFLSPTPALADTNYTQSTHVRKLSQNAATSFSGMTRPKHEKQRQS